MMDIPLPPMNPQVAHLRRQAAQRKYVRRLRYVRVLWAMAGALLLALFIEAIVALCVSPRFWITRIEVKGGETLTAAEIIRLLAVPEQTNYYRVRLNTLADRVRKEPRVQDVTVRRGPIGTLIAEITERVPLCRLGAATPPQFLDGNRVLFTRPDLPKVPVVDGVVPLPPLPRKAFGAPMESDRVAQVIDCLQTAHTLCEGENGLDIARVIVAPNGRMTLVLRQGTRILLGWPNHFTEKIWVVKNTIVYASSKGYSLDKLAYIDTRAYARPAGLSSNFMLKEQAEAPTP